MNNILVIGAVKTTLLTMESLVKHGFNIVGILGHEPKNIGNVSGWADLGKSAKSFDIDYKGFSRINDQENIEWAEKKKPDIIFAVGFSQLMRKQWLEMPTLGCVGFHPTNLPKGRGRAPIAWLVMEENKGAACFFLMGEGADDGPVFVQKSFAIDKGDDAGSVEGKIGEAIKEALDIWLPKLKHGEWNPIPQEELKASWYGKRNLEDGLIDWTQDSEKIDRLIKASAKPHPGAYTYHKDNKMIIWKSRIERDIPIKGVIGRVLLVNSNSECLVQCGEGLLWLIAVTFDNEELLPRVGEKLGYSLEDEIYKLKQLLTK